MSRCCTFAVAEQINGGETLTSTHCCPWDEKSQIPSIFLLSFCIDTIVIEAFKSEIGTMVSVNTPEPHIEPQITLVTYRDTQHSRLSSPRILRTTTSRPRHLFKTVFFPAAPLAALPTLHWVDGFFLATGTLALPLKAFAGSNLLRCASAAESGSQPNVSGWYSEAHCCRENSRYSQSSCSHNLHSASQFKHFTIQVDHQQAPEPTNTPQGSFHIIQ